MPAPETAVRKSPPRAPLHGVRVADFTLHAAGPFCAHILSLLGAQLEFGAYYQAGIAVAAALFVYQQYLMRTRSRDGCFRAFRNNIWVGFAFFAGVVAQSTLAPWLEPGGLL